MGAVAQSPFEPPSAASRRTRGGATRRRQERGDRYAGSAGWNVLAEELVCYPPPLRAPADPPAGCTVRQLESIPGTTRAHQPGRHGRPVAPPRAAAAGAHLALLPVPSLDPLLPGRGLPGQGHRFAGRIDDSALERGHTATGSRRPGATARVAAPPPRRRHPCRPRRPMARSGALSDAHQPHLVVIPGSVPSRAGYLYIVRPGDTLWGIASRVEPGGDPRPLVYRLQAQLHGCALSPGERIVLP